MKIQFMGAAGTVTGSSYILTSGSGRAILIDLGMFQGPELIEQLNYEPYAFDCKKLVGAVLTHAHLDHCGRLPLLLSGGYEGEIWMTAATSELTELSLLDSAKIAKQDEKPILYDKELALKTIERFKTTAYDTEVQVGDFKVTFRNAGHILGSASLEVEDTLPNDLLKRIVFSGDLGNSPEPLELATQMPKYADAVVIESTYGDRLHPEGSGTESVIAEVVNIEKSGGTLLIPAFSLERTQELLHLLMHAKKQGIIKAETPIYLDSPMGKRATEIYLQHLKDLNGHIQEDERDGSPFEFPGLNVVQDHEASLRIYETTGPKVILAGSGMMTGGRIMGHAAHYLPFADTRLLIVGYQGEGTLGRALAEGNREVVIEGVRISVKASVGTIATMSSHADQGQLLHWLGNISGVSKVFITHGEEPQRQALKTKINEQLKLKDITLPALHQEVSF